jgi:phosphatidylglycerol---prolipoprotein diacylglyceryl transferase
MRPTLFHWGGFTIRSYPAMLYLGLVAGLVAGDVAAHAAGIDAFRAYLALTILTVPALLGARLLHVVLHWPVYWGNPRLIWNRSQAGAAQYGGLPLILPVSVPLLAALHLPLGAFWDVATFTILITMILGRVGCLMHGCCAGRSSQCWLAIRLPDHLGVRQKRIPTQLLEAAWAAVLLLCAVAAWRRLPFPGALFLTVTAAYASGRLVMESLREQERAARKFNVFHGFSLALVVLSLAMLAARWPK